jgi:ubiquinone/menaquinone biosynthesis C-methylase UbiE
MAKDLFSNQASTYLKYRPGYPAALFEAVSKLARSSKTPTLAWDCATGNGQAATGLTPFFDQVWATDLSENQIKHAIPAPQIHYEVAPAENSGLAPQSVDLTTVAQALHWFKFENFYAEVKRVSKPGAAIAIWTYGLPTVAPEVDQAVLEFYENEVGPFWEPERRHVEDEYRSIPFPFDEVKLPAFYSEAHWKFENLVGLLESWSATQTAKKSGHPDILEKFLPRLEKIWGDPVKTVKAEWKITVRAGLV